LRDEFSNYINIPNSQAIWFWSKTKKHGKSADWRQMTPQQLAVLELFDALWSIRENELTELAQEQAKAKKGF
jgi:hypothetical protein